ncbi:MAG: hypothetical protein LBB48_02745 [Treponema sp.]|jgi:hypothetical protein|nr:hypothetical protein [Treponema sp.]
MSVNKKNNKKLGAPFLAALEAAVLAAVLCAGLPMFTGCKDLFHPEGPENESSASTVSLSNNRWYSTTLYAGDVHYYSFYAYSGYNCYIYWEDYDYSNSYGDIKVSAINSSGTYLLDSIDVGYSGPNFYVSSSGTITLVVEGLSASSSGYYRIKFVN